MENHKLIECIPKFNMRLKVNPKTNRIEFSADVNSVFDIAWFTLARMISEDPAPKNKGQADDRPEGIMICCRNCGNFLIRRNGRQEYCDKPDCPKVRNAKNPREFRRRKRIKNAQKQKQNITYWRNTDEKHTTAFHMVAPYFTKLCVASLLPPM